MWLGCAAEIAERNPILTEEMEPAVPV